MPVFAAVAATTSAAAAVSLLVGLGLVATLFPVTAIAAVAVLDAIPVCRRSRLAAVTGLRA